MKKARVLCTSVLAMIASVTHADDRGFYLGLDAGASRAELDRDLSGIQLAVVIPETTSQDRSDTAVGVHFGYGFSKHLAVELAYVDAGAARYTIDQTLYGVATPQVTPSLDPSLASLLNLAGPRVFYGDFEALPTDVIPAPVQSVSEVTMSTKALALSVRGRYEFANSIGVFGAVGLSDHHVDTRLRISSELFDPISRKDSDRATFWQLAAGVDWAFHPNWSWRLQYERHMGADSKSFFGVVRGDLGWLSTGLSYRF